MGKNMVLHLRERGIDVVAYNRTPMPEASVSSIDDLVHKLQPPRVIWLMIPNGAPIDEVLGKFTLTPGDILIDGGNTYYKDTVRRSGELLKKGIHYIDSGTSGGTQGARTGACLMLGGEEAIVKELSWLWDGLAVKGGWNYFGPSGAGHFVKMVHNGIEYGMDQAIGEGMEILSSAPYQLDLKKVADTWQQGSIIKGYLIELLARALAIDPRLDSFTGKIGGGETGGWTLAAAREFGIEIPVIENAIAARQKSLGHPTVSSKVVSALRKEYGGHSEAGSTVSK
jgi:6-phosphogluconate dehydrogenase